MKQPRPCLTLFLDFFRIGLFTFGGGYAMLPLIESVCVERRSWITHEEMLQITVVAESTPGPVAINCATYVGNRRAGFLGALAATAGVVLPSFLVILAISLFLDRFLEIRVIANAFRGIKIAVSLLIAQAALRMLKRMPKKPLSQALFGLCFAVMLAINLFSLRISSVLLLVAAGCVSLGAALAAGRDGKDGEEK